MRITLVSEGRSFWLNLLVHAALTQVISYALRPAISLAVVEQGYPVWWLGLLGVVFALPSLFLAIGAGRWVDRFGERRSLLFGGAAMVLACVFAALGGLSIGWYIAASAMIGIGLVMSSVAEQAAIAKRAGHTRLDSFFGVYTLATSLGQTIGPMLLALPPERGSTSLPFGLIVSICAIAALCLFIFPLVISNSPIDHVPDRRGTLRAAGQLLGINGMLRALIASSVVLASIDIALTFFPAVTHSRGLDPLWLSLILIARSVFSMLSRGFLGYFSRILGRRRLIILGTLIAAGALFTFVLPIDPWALVVMAAIYGFAAGVCQPLTMSWVTVLAPSSERGAAISLRLAGNRLGQSVIPFVAGLVASATGVGGVFAVTSLALIVAAWASSAMPSATTDSPPPDAPT